MIDSDDEIERYARHLVLKEIGGGGQQRLAGASVALVGLGGLGGPAAQFLAAAGVGRLRLIDDDNVSLSNLQRQVVFKTSDVGRAKVIAGGEALGALNPHCNVETVSERLSSHNALTLLAGQDVVLDGSDSFATRFAVNAACHALGAALVSGAVGRWDGQVSVFHSGSTKGRPIAERAPCYRCLVPETPEEEETCARLGVIGALTGVIGAAMALEAIKLIARAGEALIGRVMLYDGLGATARVIALSPDPVCPVCGDGAPEAL